jgi:hypothetical protein
MKYVHLGLLQVWMDLRNPMPVPFKSSTKYCYVKTPHRILVQLLVYMTWLCLKIRSLNGKLLRTVDMNVMEARQISFAYIQHGQFKCTTCGWADCYFIMHCKHGSHILCRVVNWSVTVVVRVISHPPYVDPSPSSNWSSSAVQMAGFLCLWREINHH